MYRQDTVKSIEAGGNRIFMRGVPILCFLLGMLIAVAGSAVILSAAVWHKTADRIVAQEELLSLEE